MCPSVHKSLVLQKPTNQNHKMKFEFNYLLPLALVSLLVETAYCLSTVITPNWSFFTGSDSLDHPNLSSLKNVADSVAVYAESCQDSYCYFVIV